MKRLIMIVLVLSFGTTIFAQLGRPTTHVKDTFFVKKVTYNGTELNKADWPCKYIVEDALRVYVGRHVYVKGKLVKESVLEGNSYKATCNGKISNLKIHSFFGRMYEIDDYRFVVEEKGSGSGGQGDTKEEEKKVDQEAALQQEVLNRGDEEVRKTRMPMIGNTQLSDNNLSSEDAAVAPILDEEPEFPGGAEELYKYLSHHIQYPALARENNITGRVFITFIVETDGSLSNVRVLRDIGGGCGSEAVRVVKAMPKWKPGKQQGEAVRVQYNLPIAFDLQKQEKTGR